MDTSKFKAIKMTVKEVDDNRDDVVIACSLDGKLPSFYCGRFFCFIALTKSAHVPFFMLYFLNSFAKNRSRATMAYKRQSKR